MTSTVKETKIEKNQINLENSNRKKDSLPLEFFPNCWVKDEQRMDVLFNPFRPKNINPVNYESKMKFWKSLIVKYCEEKGSACISLTELKNAFIRNGKKPLCLQTVLDDMQNSCEIERLNKFMVPVQHSWKGWAIDVMVKKPASWGWNVIKDRIFQPNSQAEEVENFIVLEGVKKHAEILQGNCNANEVLILSDIMNKSKELGLTSDGTEYALQFLKKCQKVDTAVVQNVNGDEVNVVKFAKVDSKISITDSDKTMFNLIQTEDILTRKTESIESQILQMDVKIRAYINEKNRDMAKNYLKRKKMLINELDKHLGQLQHICTLKSNIESAKYNAGVIETYKMGAKALKEIYEQNGLTVDRVEDVISDVRDIIDDHDEIQDIVAAVNISSTNIDEQELEQELQDLIDDKRNDDNNVHPTNRTNTDDSLEQQLNNLRLPNLDSLSLNVNDRAQVNVQGS